MAFCFFVAKNSIPNDPEDVNFYEPIYTRLVGNRHYRKGCPTGSAGSSHRSFISCSWKAGSIVLCDTLPKLSEEHIFCAKVLGLKTISYTPGADRAVMWTD